MRILVCALEAPLPPPTGLRLPLIELVRRLAGTEGHEVRVLAFRWPDQHGEVPAGVDLVAVPRRPPGRLEDARALVHAVSRRRPLRADDHADRMRVALRAEIARFAPEVVHVFSGRLAAVADVLDGIPSVLSALDAWHRNVAARRPVEGPLRRWLLSGEERRVRRFEATEYPRYGRVVVVSDADRDELRRVAPDARVVVIPNGVDAAAFTAVEVPKDPRRLVFHGVLNFAPNVTAARTLVEDILPLVRARVPDAHVVLVGRTPDPRVRALGAVAGVEVVGEVPDVRPWLAGSAVYVCPMTSGTGIKNKLLEAMAAGLPCVVTPLSLQGLEVEDGREVLVGASPRSIAAHVVRLLEDPGLAAELGAAARRYVTARHSWDAVTAAYERVYVEVVAEASR